MKNCHYFGKFYLVSHFQEGDKKILKFCYYKIEHICSPVEKILAQLLEKKKIEHDELSNLYENQHVLLLLRTAL